MRPGLWGLSIMFMPGLVLVAIPTSAAETVAVYDVGKGEFIGPPDVEINPDEAALIGRVLQELSTRGRA